MVYQVTKAFPSDEVFGLVAQMRRAAISIPANVAEGFKRRGIRDKLRFYNISEGSLEELKYYFILSKDLGYLPSNDASLDVSRDVFRDGLTLQCETMGRLLDDLVHQDGNESIVNPAPRGLPNLRFRRKRPGFGNPWRANNYAPIYAEMHLS